MSSYPNVLISGLLHSSHLTLEQDRILSQALSHVVVLPQTTHHDSNRSAAVTHYCVGDCIVLYCIVYCIV